MGSRKLYKDKVPLIWWTECEVQEDNIVVTVKYRANIPETYYALKEEDDASLKGQNSFVFYDWELLSMVPETTRENAYVLVNVLRNAAKDEQRIRDQISRLLNDKTYPQALATMSKPELIEMQKALARLCALDKYERQFVSHRL